jgi:hypothetical protein
MNGNARVRLAWLCNPASYSSETRYCEIDDNRHV